MQTFTLGTIYNHMTTAHGTIYDAENAPVQNVDIHEQQEALRQAEALRIEQQAERERQERMHARQQGNTQAEDGRWCIVM
jgi:hypothetical protein